MEEVKGMLLEACVGSYEEAKKAEDFPTVKIEM